MCFGFRSSIRSGAIDFRLYYAAGYMIRTGDAAHLYDYRTEERVQNAVVAPEPTALPLFAPPFAAYPFIPLSWAPYRWALFLFALANVGCLALAATIMRPYLPALTQRWAALPFALFFSFLPVALTLMMGQLSILMLLIYCVSFAAVQKGRPFLAGLVLSLALMKFQTAVPIALLFLAWRQWRFSLGFLSGAAGLLALSAWTVGPQGLLPYFRSLLHMSAMAGTALQESVGLHPRRMPNLHGLFSSILTGNYLAVTVTLLVSFVLLGWAITRQASLPFAVLVAILVSYHFYPCDLVLLLLPLSLLADRYIRQDGASESSSHLSASERWRTRAVLCSLAIFIIGPITAEIMSNDLIFLLALPIAALCICPKDWSRLERPVEPRVISALRPSSLRCETVV
jgi:hypothetical protein